MAGINECNADLDGKRAALDLAKSRPEDFSAQCWNIDNKLNSASTSYTKAFISAMDRELETRNLLPKVELNMVGQADNSALQPLQDPHKHIDTQDLANAADEYSSNGRNVERNLVDGLMHHQNEIQGTHAERNFWGKNHGGIDMNRLNHWANQTHPDFYGAQDDLRGSRPNQSFGPDGLNNQTDANKTTGADSRKSAPTDSNAPADSRTTADNRLPASTDNHKGPKDKPTGYDRTQDEQIQALRDQLAKEKQARQLQATVEAGVNKDAHHTVQRGETLRDMACLALHKAGQVHMSEGMIKHEEAKIRMVNGLAVGEELRPGTSLMLRTSEEVAHETARRIAAYDHHQHSQHSPQAMLNNFSIRHDSEDRTEFSPPRYADRDSEESDSRTNSHRTWQLPAPGYIN